MKPRRRTVRRGALLVGLVAVACGGGDKKQEQAAPPEEGSAVPDRPPANVDTAPLTLGLQRPGDFGYEWGKAARAFAPADDARKKQDWVAVRSACEQAVAADALHLDAHRLLASALAQQGEYEKALEHLKVALAGDWVKFGAAALADPDLEPLTSSPLGAALKQMVAAHREQFARSARAGLMLVARRAAFKPPQPKKPGASARLASRAEVFAYVKETQRYLRLTQTGFQVLGFLPSPSGDEIAYVAATHVVLAEPAPILSAAQVGTVSLASPEIRTPAASIKNARALAIEYAAGDELIATSYDPQGAWGLGEARAFTVDRGEGKATPTRLPDGTDRRRLIARYETVELEGAGDAEGIAADWNPDTGAAEEFVIESSQKRVQLPAGGAAARSSLAWSPDRTRLAFATAADPCAPQEFDRQSSLYVVEAESGKLKHVFKGPPRLRPRFADSATLAFEDDSGNIRLYDAAVAREVGRLESRGGLAFAGLGALPAPPCQAVTAEPTSQATPEP